MASGDNALHMAARSGNLDLVVETISNNSTGSDGKLKELLSKQNHSGKIPLYIAAELGHVQVAAEMMKHYDVEAAGTRARNGYDPFHIAAKQGHLGVVKVLMEAIPELAMTVDLSNTTALHTAAAQGHVEVVDFLLEHACCLAAISRSNGKTALHSAARNGHLKIVKALLHKDSGIATRIDRKKQTALHMAVKGHDVDLVSQLVDTVPPLINMFDSKGNTALHIATKKDRAQIVEKLLTYEEMDTSAVNKQGETALDTAEQNAMSSISYILSNHNVQSAKDLEEAEAEADAPSRSKSKDFKQTVTVIRHTVHNQLQHSRQTGRRVQGMAKRLEKMHLEGLNNAINSTTVVAVLIATVAFAAIFSIPGKYADDLEKLAPGISVGEAMVGPKKEFVVFFVFDSFALFLSLGVVVVQTSVVVTERKAKKKLMVVINKLMWLACVMVSVAFLALSYIVVGDHDRVLAVGVTLIGTVIMATTLGTMCCWVLMNKLESFKLRKTISASPSRSNSNSIKSESDKAPDNHVYKTVYAI